MYMNKTSQSIKKIMDIIECLIRWTCMIMLVAMAFLGIMQVIFRYVFNHSLSFSEESIIFLFVWVTFLGSALCLRHYGHASFGAIIDRLPRFMKASAGVVITLVNITFLSVLVIKGFEFISITGDKPSVSMQLPMRYVYLSIPIGSICMIIFSIEQLFGYIGHMTKVGKEEQ